MQREGGIQALREARSARLDVKAIREAKKSPPSLAGKSANPVLADLQEEVKDTGRYECACLLAASPKPKDITEATTIFEALIAKGFREADCRRQLGVLCLLEGRYREASEWLAHPSLLVPGAASPLPSSSSSPHPPWIATISKDPVFEDLDISARDVLKWSLELESETRAKLIKDFKTKYLAEFNPRQLIGAKSSYQRHPTDQNTFTFATLLSHSSQEQHRNEALSVFETLVNKGFRKSVCQGRRGILHFMSDRLELATSFLQASLSEYKHEAQLIQHKEARVMSPARQKDSLSRNLEEEEAFRVTVQTVLDWSTATLTCWERLDPQKIIEQEAREEAAEKDRRVSLEGRKRRETIRQQWIKLEASKAEALRGFEAKLRGEGVSQDEIAKRMEDCINVESARASAARAFVAKNALANATVQVALAKAAAVEPQKLADAAAAQVAHTRMLEATPPITPRTLQIQSAQDRMAREAQERLLSLRKSRTPNKALEPSATAEQTAQAVEALEKAELAARKAKQQVDDALEAEKTARLALEVAEEDLRFRLSLFNPEQVPSITAAQTAAQLAATAATSAAKCAARAVANAETAENAVALVAAAGLRATANVQLGIDTSPKPHPSLRSDATSPPPMPPPRPATSPPPRTETCSPPPRSDTASPAPYSLRTEPIPPPSLPLPQPSFTTSNVPSIVVEGSSRASSRSSSPSQTRPPPPPTSTLTLVPPISVSRPSSPRSRAYAETVTELPSPANVSGAILDDIFGTSVEPLPRKSLNSPSRVSLTARRPPLAKAPIASPKPPAVPPPRSPKAPPRPPATRPTITPPVLPAKSPVKSPSPPPRLLSPTKSTPRPATSPRNSKSITQQDTLSILDGIFDAAEPSGARRPASPSSRGAGPRSPSPKPLKRGASLTNLR